MSPTRLLAFLAKVGLVLATSATIGILTELLITLLAHWLLSPICIEKGMITGLATLICLLAATLYVMAEA